MPLPDTHVFANGLTRADVRIAVACVYARRARREQRSRENCRFVRELMHVKEPRIAAAYDRAVEQALQEPWWHIRQDTQHPLK